jgi:hypothetical protein
MRVHRHLDGILEARCQPGREARQINGERHLDWLSARHDDLGRIARIRAERRAGREHSQHQRESAEIEDAVNALVLAQIAETTDAV